jgi:hypothetical protein
MFEPLSLKLQDFPKGPLLKRRKGSDLSKCIDVLLSKDTKHIGIGNKLILNRLGAFTLGVVITAMSVGAVSLTSAAGDKTIKACANKKTGAMRYISKGSCKKTETSLTWNQMGPQGMPGAPGAAGVNGAKGDTGTAGARGETGALGLKGDTGAEGSSSPTGFTPRSVCGPSGTELCTIGTQGPGGGTVFYVDTKNEIAEFDYLEAAPTNAVFNEGNSSGVWATNELRCGPDADAACDVSYVSDAAQAAETWGLGTGRAATKAIVARYRNSTIPKTSYAAGTADAYETTTASDWWLPSWDESTALCKFAVRQSVVNDLCLGGTLRPGFRSNTTYWTSTGFTFGVMGHEYSDGGGGLVGKTEQHAVHPIRGF